MASATKFEQHIQTVVTTLVAGALGWLAFTVQENNVQIAVLSEKVDKLERRSYALSEAPLRTPAPQFPTMSVDALPASYPDHKFRK